MKQPVKISDLLKIKKPLVVGILNVTPDSFSDGGKYFQIQDAIDHARELIKDGADIIDIGGESTRPAATSITEEEELRRVIPIIKWCRDVALQRLYNHGFIISIDTYKSTVAQRALEAGANMINDVSGLTKDPNMVHVARDTNCPIVIMHNKGIPATKPSNDDCRGMPPACPADVVQEIYRWLQKQTNYAVENGVKRENIIIDPGIGFGKSAEEDFALIENLHEFKSLRFPILIGVSRKSFIKKILGECNIDEKSKELTDLAVKNGADIVRVH